MYLVWAFSQIKNDSELKADKNKDNGSDDYNVKQYVWKHSGLHFKHRTKLHTPNSQTH